MSIKEQVHDLIDRLSEDDLRVVERLLRGLSATEATPSVAAPLSPEERRARVNAARGSMKGMLSGSDEIAARKQEEIVLEADQWARLHGPRLTS
ncbi:MAG: hypothetical protein GX774_11825 [Armatimonadetes bacterium]|jgi:hypothetical protein|nr:hypothetical protein [Armatimonadota bacterium]